MIRIIRKTDDGSPTFYVPGMNESYHSMYEAVQESDSVYIDKLIRPLNQQVIRIFEIGFGTGLNALLSWREAEKERKNICFHSIEKYPLKKEEWEEFGRVLEEWKGDCSGYRRMHMCEWEKDIAMGDYFKLQKIKADFTRYETEKRYDAVFFDAFGPDVQPELWTERIFTKIFSLMEPGGVLSTYSSKGMVRRNMQSAGLSVQRIPGPPGKRQMILASKPFPKTGTLKYS